METGKLYMQYRENGQPEVIFEPMGGTVFLTVNQIAKFLGCFPATVNSHLRSIIKSGVFHEPDICCHYKYMVPNAEYSERQGVLYNLDVIIALAYRIKSLNSEVFRNWLTRRICGQDSRQKLFEGFIWN